MKTKNMLALLISILCFLTLSLNIEARGRYLDITITPDKAEDYVIEEKATFDIEMMRHNRPANIKLKQIEATFPNEEIPVNLTKVSKGKFKYISQEFEETGEKTLSLTVRTYGAVRSVEKLERSKERFDKKIEKLEKRKEQTNNERLKRLIDKLIARYQKIIQKIEAKIEKIREKGIIGEASLTINVIPIAPPPEVPESGHIYGNVYDSVTELHIYEVVITVEGIEGGVSTDEEGRFRFPISEFEGDFRDAKLLIQKEGYISVTRNISVVSERDVSVGDIYLKEVDPVVTEITPAGGEATDSTETVKIIFPPDAVSEPVDIVITPYEEEKEMPQELPLATNAIIGVNVEAEGAVLTEPVTVELPNDKGFAPGTLIPIGSYDPDIEEWVHETFGVVSADGTKITYQTTHFSDQVAGLPTAPDAEGATPSSHGDDDDDDPDECSGESKSGSRIGFRFGNLILEHVLPEVKYLGKTEELTLRYNTETVNPRPRISMKLKGPSGGPGGRPTPETYGFDISIGDEKRHVVFESQPGWYKQSYMFDARDGDGNLLPTGSYPYSANTSNDYDSFYCLTDEFGGPPLVSTGIPTDKPVALPMLVPGRVEIQNETSSPYGAGWSIEGMQRMHFDPDGTILITSGGKGSMDIFVAGEEVAKGFGVPGFIAISPEGDIIVTDPFISQMTEVAKDEIMTVTRIKPDGSKIRVTNLERPTGLVYDTFGNLYIASARHPRYENGNPIPGTFPAILRIDPLGGTTELPSPAVVPGALAIDAGNNLYVADIAMGRIYKMTPLGEVSIFAKGFQKPGEMAFDVSGNLYVANGLKSGISKITPTGEKTVLLRDIKKAGGLAIAPDGKILVTGIEKGVIYRVDPIAETYEIIASGFMYPAGIAINGNEIIVGNASHGVISKIGINGEIKGYTGPSTDYSTLTKNIDGTYTRRDKHGTETIFNEDGLQIKKTDRNNNITSYTYIDANGNSKVEELSSIILPTGQTYTLSYNASGKLQSLTDPANRVTQFAIDGESNLTQITNPDGTTRQFTYNQGNHLVITKTNERGNTNEYTYDEKGKIDQVMLPERDVAEINPDTGEVTITRKRPTHTYGPSIVKGNTNDLPEGVGTEENPAPTVALTELTDDYTDQTGNQTIYRTDRHGKVIEKTDALGNLTKTDRDREGNARKTIRANGGVAEMKYDEKNNLIRLKDAEGGITQYGYDPLFNQITAITDANGNTTRNYYDEKGNLIETKDALNNSTTMTYDSRGLLTSTTDALDNTTSFTYDDNGNLATITDPLGNTATMDYDLAGNLISSEDAEERITQYKYDEMNKLVKVIDADSNETSYAYDNAGNLTSVTDAKNQTTSYEYDEHNNLSSVINEAGQHEIYAYDAQKNLSAITDKNGNTITHVYCPLNNLIKKFLPDGEIVAYSYDTTCNLVNVKDADSEVSILYDLDSRVISSSTAGSLLQPEVTIGYSYDVNGNKVTMTDPAGTTDYGYNDLNRLISLTNPNVQSTTFGYDELSRRTSMTLANGIITSYDYDSASQLTSLQSSVVSYLYNYDKVGNRTAMTELAGPNNYTYDLLNRLISSTHPQPVNPAETFTYDTVGNRLISHISPSYIYDNLNRLTEDNEYNYTYDNNGNMISKTDKTTLETTTYTYNAENQLIRINFPDLTYAEYKYDGLGRRIQKDANGVVTKYVYDEEDVILEYDGASQLLARYTHGPGIDEPLIMERASQSYFYHVDGLGSITTLTNSAGNIAQTYVYDSFGNIVEQTGSLINPYTYTGREYDSESRLYYYRARYYDAKVGRFITADPIGFLGGINFYVYARNNPVNWIDPLGLRECCPGEEPTFHRRVYWVCIARKVAENIHAYSIAVVISAYYPIGTTIGLAGGGAMANLHGYQCRQEATFCD